MWPLGATSTDAPATSPVQPGIAAHHRSLLLRGVPMPSERNPLHTSGFDGHASGGCNSARTLVTWISRRLSATSNHTPSDINLELAQRISASFTVTQLVPFAGSFAWLPRGTLLLHWRRTTGGPPWTARVPTSGRSRVPTLGRVTRTPPRRHLSSRGAHLPSLLSTSSTASSSRNGSISSFLVPSRLSVFGQLLTRQFPCSNLSSCLRPGLVLCWVFLVARPSRQTLTFLARPTTGA